MKRIISITLVLITLLLCLSACGCEHVWEEATCETPQTCSVCGKTEGKPLGHSFSDATCTVPKKCRVCGDTEGLPIEHTYIPANCYSPKECSVCGETEGQALGHDYVNHICTRCGNNEQTLKDIGFYDFQGVTEYVRIYGYNLSEGWVECKSKSKREFDFYDGHLYSCLIGDDSKELEPGTKSIFNIIDNDTIYLPSRLGYMRIMDRKVISEEKQQIILTLLNDSDGTEMWFISKNALDFSSIEKEVKIVNGEYYDKLYLK